MDEECMTNAVSASKANVSKLAHINLTVNEQINQRASHSPSVSYGVS